MDTVSEFHTNTWIPEVNFIPIHGYWKRISYHYTDTGSEFLTNTWTLEVNFLPTHGYRKYVENIIPYLSNDVNFYVTNKR
jgi:hypothetical protein